MLMNNYHLGRKNRDSMTLSPFVNQKVVQDDDSFLDEKISFIIDLENMGREDHPNDVLDNISELDIFHTVS